MGICDSKASRTQSVHSKRINNQLDKERRADSGNVKLLLLGTGECGKSTILKQMRILHKNGFTPEEVEEKKTVIYGNIITSMGEMLRAMDRLDITLQHEGRQTNANIVLKITSSDQDFAGPINDELRSALKLLWADSGVQQVFDRRSEYQITDSVRYFLDDLDRICSTNFKPNEQDILMSRVATTGVVEVAFVIKECIFRVFDVGGQRSERRKWIHLFDDVDAIVFISAISEYDQVLLEDQNTNRLAESMTLFRWICNHQWFMKASMILFLNKTDLFSEKLLRVPLSSYFDDYDGENDYQRGVLFLKDKFEKLNEMTSKRIYIHETCATDTRQVQHVIDSVADTVLAANIKTAGML